MCLAKLFKNIYNTLQIIYISMSYCVNDILSIITLYTQIKPMMNAHCRYNSLSVVHINLHTVSDNRINRLHNHYGNCQIMTLIHKTKFC